MTALSPRLRLALISQKKKQSMIQQGFTLVELMIVVVIVGILSALALPNFLSQSDKAKITEAQQQNSAYLKQAFAEYQFDGGLSIDEDALCPATTSYWTYTCNNIAQSAPTITIIATGEAGAGSTLSGPTLTSSIDTATGIITLGTVQAPAPAN